MQVLRRQQQQRIDARKRLVVAALCAQLDEVQQAAFPGIARSRALPGHQRMHGGHLAAGEEGFGGNPGIRQG